MHGFGQFIRERRYLKNVSPRTIEWYENSFRWLSTPPTTVEASRRQPWTPIRRSPGGRCAASADPVIDFNPILENSESPAVMLGPESARDAAASGVPALRPAF